jgi:hypothetical protein
VELGLEEAKRAARARLEDDVLEGELGPVRLRSAISCSVDVVPLPVHEAPQSHFYTTVRE